MQSGHTYRFKADGSAAEIYSFGQVNPFGLARATGNPANVTTPADKPEILAKYDLSDYTVKETGLNLGGTKP
mgnify:CR=1 FL=1